MLNLKYVLDKLERLLLPEEFLILLLRYSLFHLRFPPTDLDTGKAKELKAISAHYGSQQ